MKGVLHTWKETPEESGWETKDSLWRWKEEIAEFDDEVM